MKLKLLKGGVVFGILTTITLAGLAQTTATRGTPTITGFVPNAVSGFTAKPVTGFTPAPVQGLSSPAVTTPGGTRFTTGSVAPLSTTIAGVATNSRFIAPVPTAPVARPPVVSNAVGTPLF